MARAAPLRVVFFLDAARLGCLARRRGEAGCEEAAAVVEAGVLALRGRRRDAVMPFSEVEASTGAATAAGSEGTACEGAGCAGASSVGVGPAGAAACSAETCSTETVEFSRDVGGVGSSSMP